jgi:hypothetical protein
MIHTVKHGPCLSEDRKTEGTAEFHTFCTGLSEADILSRDSRITANTESRARYSEEYQHFDKLIWQVPAWTTAIFALSFQSVGSDSIRNVASLAGVSTNHLATFLLFGLSLMIFCFAYVLYRFRVYQRSLKEYAATSPFSICIYLYTTNDNSGGDIPVHVGASYNRTISLVGSSCNRSCWIRNFDCWSRVAFTI